MKEYRLSAWPDLDASYERTPYRRILSDMSQRHVTLAQLYERSGLPRQQVSAFVAMLVERGLVIQREAARVDRLAASLRPLGGWLRRTFSRAHGGAR
jgi:predicted Rossmann fold nucleotide-binding protein DprA/Smf involved in DNA uptake